MSLALLIDACKNSAYQQYLSKMNVEQVDRRGAGSLKKIIWAFVLRFSLNQHCVSETAHIVLTHAPKVSLRHFARMSWTFELTLVALLPRDNIFYVSIITNSPSNARNFETKMNENRTNRMLKKMLAQPNRLLVELVLVLKEKSRSLRQKRNCSVLFWKLSASWFTSKWKC